MRDAVVFLVVVFGLTWPWGFLARPLVAGGSVSGFLAALLPTVWAPTVVALLLVYLGTGTGGVRSELRARLRYRSGSGRWLILAGVLPAAVCAIAIAIARAAGEGAPFIPANALPLALGLQIITGAVGEELGWRGYLLTRLGRTVGASTTALVMASMWALWHVPAFFTPGTPHQTMPMASSLITIAAFGVFMAFVFKQAGESVLPTMAAHLSLNIAMAVGGVSLESRVFWRTTAVAFGLVAVVVWSRMRRTAAIAAEPAHAR